MFRSGKYLYSLSPGLFFCSGFYKDMKEIRNKPKKFSYDEIMKHNNIKNGVWVTYKNKVYDVSNFLEIHPGGKENLLKAAGEDVETYWKKYPQHYKVDVLNLLKDYEIGEIENYKPIEIDIETTEELKDINYHNTTPQNGEMYTEKITASWITPIKDWYVRNHFEIPKVQHPDSYKIVIELIDNDFILDYTKLLSMDSKEVITTIQCGGNRRNDMNDYKKTMGTNWNIGAISTAKWEGVQLNKLLNLDDKYKDYHLEFESIDGVKVSIPVYKLKSCDDVILAYKMNDELLPDIHGYPIRLIVPGYVGIRNLKWVSNIKLVKNECNSMWQTGLSYKPIPHYINNINNDILNKVPTVLEQPVQSCITNIQETPDNLVINGYAWSGGGRNIIRVDVSIDNGETWNMAQLLEGSEQSQFQAWAWTLWKIELPKNENKKYKVVCKSLDISYNTQPKDISSIWNIRGLVNNSWHSINYSSS